MDEHTVLEQINTLADAEREVYAGGAPLDDAGRERLRRIETALDQCWDYLRQRRAARAAGRDPDTAGIRPPATVEEYLQ